MRDERLALSTRPPAQSAETDYDAICAAVTATARGRWFLDEFARRNRNTDTLQVLDAIARMEATVVGQQARQQASQEVRIELLEMAREIAQTRADVAESQSGPHALAIEPADAATAPDVGGAAERLRQIAWTMRACGVELAASDQIGQIADAILSADALRNLGDQRASKLTEALHSLEQRIDQMLYGHLVAAAADAEKLLQETPQPQTIGRDREAAPEPTAAAAIGAAIFAAAPAVEAETEPVFPPANDDTPPAAIFEQADPEPPAEETAEAFAPEEAVEVSLSEETAQPHLSEEAAPAAAADTTEYPMDDDVVLTVTDSTVDAAAMLLPAMDMAPASFDTSAHEPTPLPVMDMAPATFIEPAPEAPPIADSIEQEADSIERETAWDPRSDTDEQAFQVEHVELEVEPLVAAPAEETETAFTGLELEPLVVTRTVAVEPRDAPKPDPKPQTPAEAHHPVVAEHSPDQPAFAEASIIDAFLAQPPVESWPAGSATAESMREHVDADDEPPLMLVTDTTVAALADPEMTAAPEIVAPTAMIAEPREVPPPAAVAADPIAMQVEHDLDDLTDILADDVPPADNAHNIAPPPLPAPVPASAVTEDDPADFLLEALPSTTPSNAMSWSSAPASMPAAPQPSGAMFATALAAMEIELRTGATLPGAGADAPASASTPRPPAVANDAALVALMAMSEEERIALFS